MAKNDDAGGEGAGRPPPGPLDGLAQRLGALEESLTVVATEVGISAMPRFKRVDPESVYKEAVRRAQDVAEPMRLALRRLEARLEETILALDKLRNDQAANGPSAETAARLDGIERQIEGLLGRFDAHTQSGEEFRSRLEDAGNRIATLSLRMDTVWQQLDDEKVRREAERDGEFSPKAILHRLVGLEQRTEKLANAIAAATTQPPATGAAAIQGEIARQLDAAIDERAIGGRAAVPADAIEREIARQLAALVAATSGARVDAVPLLLETPDEGNGEMAPLVMGATERAIVRLTHRLEKLEEWRHAQATGEKLPARGGRGLMGRLFET